MTVCHLYVGIDKYLWDREAHRDWKDGMGARRFPPRITDWYLIGRGRVATAEGLLS